MSAARTDGPDQAAQPEEHVEWRRVHKVTPVLNAWKVIVAVLAVLVYQNVEILSTLWEERGSVEWSLVLLIGGGVVVLLLAILAGYSVLSWRMMRYAVGQDAVYLHSGILFRQQRHARLNRIQGIDVVQPLLARLFGLAQLKIETAGGSGSSVVLAFLKEEEAQRLRREVLDRAAGRQQTEPAGTGDQPDGGEQGPATPGPGRGVEREVLTVPVGRLVGSLVLSGSMITFVLVVLLFVVIAIVSRSFAPLVGVLPGVFGWGTYLWNRFSTGFNFRSAISEDGIRMRHGLLEQRTQTVPPGRIHAVGLKQPLLWRRRGWWRVEMNVAGYSSLENQMEAATGTVLLPVGPRGDALTALWLVLPDLGVAQPQAVIDAALEGSGEDAGFTTSPRRARWLDPLTWRRNGVLLTDRAILVRSGRWNRSLAIIPHERTQSLAIDQGPLERRLDLANIAAAMVSGPVATKAYHLDGTTALAILGAASAHSRRARVKESPEEWMRRVGLLPSEPPAHDGPPGEPPAPASPPPAGPPTPPPAGPPTPPPPAGPPVQPPS